MYDAKILADSVTQAGHRLTTFQITFPRIVLAEFNTHRVFCLAGDMELEFDLPSGAHGGRRVHKMRVDDFVDKWLHGARRRGANPKKDYDVSWVEADANYSAPQAAAFMGMANPASINAACRRGALAAERGPDGRMWTFTGAALLEWRRSAPAHTRFDMRARLSNMRIRQLNELTGDVQTSVVADACASGRKDVYEVTAGDFTVAGSGDHQVLTADGWKTIGELEVGDFVVVRKFGKREDDKLDPLRLKKIDGRWRSSWQRDERDRLVAEDPLCRRCREAQGTEVHHLEPVYRNPSRAFDPSNITLVCDPCHDVAHEDQDWQGGTYLYGSLVKVESVALRGVEDTYDLTIAGRFPNFIANGVVVHNSRNSASSRAIPVEKRIEAILELPFIPAAFGANKRGMQAGDELTSEEQDECRAVWLDAMQDAVKHSRRLVEIGVHKQWANRLLEPFAWHTVIVTATEWANYWGLRVSTMAQPEIFTVSERMKALFEASEPDVLHGSEWHLPLVGARYGDDLRGYGDGPEIAKPALVPERWQRLVRLSVARCARVSYLTHEGVRDPGADEGLYQRLTTNGHMSPTEHAARPMTPVELRLNEWCGNFRGWVQHRKEIPGEAVFTGDDA